MASSFAATSPNELPAGFLDELRERRAVPLKVAELLDNSHPELAAKMRQCLATVDIVENVKTGHNFPQPQTCRRRMCPICGYRRSGKFARTYAPYFARWLSGKPNRGLFMVTMTQAPMHKESAIDALHRIAKTAKRLCNDLAAGQLAIGSGVFVGLEFAVTNESPQAHAHALVAGAVAPSIDGLTARWSSLSPGSRMPHVLPFDVPRHSSATVYAACKRAIRYVTKPFPWPILLSHENQDDLIEAAAAIQSLRTVRTYGDLYGWLSRTKGKRLRDKAKRASPKYRVSRTLMVPTPKKSFNPYRVPFLLSKD